MACHIDGERVTQGVASIGRCDCHSVKKFLKGVICEEFKVFSDAQIVVNSGIGSRDCVGVGQWKRAERIESEVWSQVSCNRITDLVNLVYHNWCNWQTSLTRYRYKRKVR